MQVRPVLRQHCCSINSVNSFTLLDGLRANSLGSLTWPIIRDLVDQIVTVTEVTLTKQIETTNCL